MFIVDYVKFGTDPLPRTRQKHFIPLAIGESSLIQVLLYLKAYKLYYP